MFVFFAGFKTTDSWSNGNQMLSGSQTPRTDLTIGFRRGFRRHNDPYVFQSDARVNHLSATPLETSTNHGCDNQHLFPTSNHVPARKRCASATTATHRRDDERSSSRADVHRDDEPISPRPFLAESPDSSSDKARNPDWISDLRKIFAVNWTLEPIKLGASESDDFPVNWP